MSMIELLDKISSGEKISSGDDKELTMSRLYWEKKENIFCSKISVIKLLCWQVMAFLLLTLYRWIQIHALKKSNSYYMDVWLENVAALCLISISIKMRVNSIKKLWKALFPVILPYLILTAITCIDFQTFTRKSSGTEFYQYFFAVSLPVLLVVLCHHYENRLPKYISCIIVLQTSWKLMILFQDPEFEISFLQTVFGLVVAVVHAIYVLNLKAAVEYVPVLELFFILSLSIVVALPLFLLKQYEENVLIPWYYNMTFKHLLYLMLLGFLKFTSFSFVLMLLKNGDPITTMLATNLTFIPDNFIQALVYKLDCTLSSSKVCILMVFETVLVNVWKIFFHKE